MMNEGLQSVFLLWLKGKIRQHVLPPLKVFEFGTSGVTRNLDPVVTDGAGVLIILLEFAAGDLQAFAVVPF
jgi:hypothetical protein